jgi:hypothetical protein
MGDRPTTTTTTTSILESIGADGPDDQPDPTLA